MSIWVFILHKGKDFCSLKSVLESCSLINIFIRHEKLNSYIEKALHLKVITILNYICMIFKEIDQLCWSVDNWEDISSVKKNVTGNTLLRAKKLFIYKIFHIPHILNAVYSVYKDLLWLTIWSEHHVIKSSAEMKFYVIESPNEEDA